MEPRFHAHHNLTYKSGRSLLRHCSQKALHPHSFSPPCSPSLSCVYACACEEPLFSALFRESLHRNGFAQIRECSPYLLHKWKVWLCVNSRWDCLCTLAVVSAAQNWQRFFATTLAALVVGSQQGSMKRSMNPAQTSSMMTRSMFCNFKQFHGFTWCLEIGLDLAQGWPDDH